MAEQVQQALQGHEAARKATELPLYYGTAKDVTNAQLYIERFETAAKIANWHITANNEDNQPRKCQHFYLLLRDKALQWWKSLEETPEVNKKSWTDIKREFLEAYAPRYTARSAFVAFQDLHQRKENVTDFYLRCMEMYERMKEGRPESLYEVRDETELDDDQGNWEDVRRSIKAEGIADTGRFFMKQLFLAGLREEIRLKVMESNPTTLRETLKLAREMEVIQGDKRTKVNVFKVGMEEDSSEDEEEGDYISEAELDAIDAIRRRNGRPPIKRRKFFKNRASLGKCFNCSQTGHIAKECKKPLQKKGYQKGRANAIIGSQNEEEENNGDEELMQELMKNLTYGINAIEEAQLLEEELKPTEQGDWGEAALNESLPSLDESAPEVSTQENEKVEDKIRKIHFALYYLSYKVGNFKEDLESTLKAIDEIREGAVTPPWQQDGPYVEGVDEVDQNAQTRTQLVEYSDSEEEIVDLN